MKRLILIILLALSVPCFGATIKFYTDYPNSLPLSSDFLLFQRNNSYVNAAQSQYLPLWFTSPTFTGTPVAAGNFVVNGIVYGNGLGLTNVNASGTNSSFTYITNFTLYSTNIFVENITNNTFITTNVTVEFPGGLTNLNLTPNSVMYADANDAEASIPNAVGVLTNNGVGGIGFSSTLFLSELDVLNFYPTNLFTFITNAQYLMTDGNGKVVNGTGLPGTNVLLSAGPNIEFTTNANGGITIESTGTNFVDTSTNNLIVVTNIIVYSNLTVLQNIYASTNFSTNLYFVSGKGNTLIITNNLNLIYLTASKLVSTDGAKNITNADITTDLSFSGNVLGIAAGAKPTLNLYNSTNLNISAIVSPTNGVNVASAVDFSVPEATTNIAGAVSFTSLSNFNQTNYNHAIRYIINRTGSDQTITVGTWETDSARTSATTYTATNNTTLALMFSTQIGQFTNVTAYKTFR